MSRDALGGIVRALRPYAERLPWLATGYRDVRERLRARYGQAVPTSLGFRFAGYSHMVEGDFEPLETGFVTHELASTDVFVDVGANIGYYTCMARAKSVHTIAIEPLDSNLRVLYKNVAANGWRDGVEVFPVALSDVPGLLELYGTNTGASLIPGWAGRASSNARLVPVSTLDALLASRFDGQRLLIKVDVEGVEHQVLRGATRTLAREPSPRWIMEVCLTENQPGVNPHFLEVFEAFWSHGYRAETLEERRAITRNDVKEWIVNGRRSFGSYSVLFIRATAPAQAI
ncbi:MAG: FkbM family methyltransferase [Myxococcota bacterium]|nr:FkbM family methyltransferase [Myxococcota bacterium]